MIQTDILIIGAGPTGLFAVFEAGLLKLRCHLIDTLTKPGGQCAEIYPKKPIYDIPSQPEILAGDLVNNLLEQIAPFQPGFTLGEQALHLEKRPLYFRILSRWRRQRSRIPSLRSRRRRTSRTWPEGWVSGL